MSVLVKTTISFFFKSSLSYFSISSLIILYAFKGFSFSIDIKWTNIFVLFIWRKNLWPSPLPFEAPSISPGISEIMYPKNSPKLGSSVVNG